MEMTKTELRNVLNFFNGKQRPNTVGNYPVYGGNGIIDYVSEYNYEDNIIIGRVGANCGSIQKCEDKCWVSDNAISVTVKEGFCKNFIYHMLVALDLNKKHVGAAQPLITQEIIAKQVVALPSFENQKKIAAVLSALDEKIALNKKMNQKLEAMAKRLYDYWFVQFDFPDENDRPYKTSGGPMTHNPTLNREIPKGWNNGVLSDVANITMGQSPNGSSYNENGDGILFYQGSTDFGIRFPSVRQYTTAPTRFAKKGDILMSVRAPVGAVNIANADCCIGRGLSSMNSKLGSLSHLYFLIDIFKKTFENMSAAGTTFGSITKDELYALPVIIPSKQVLEKFEKIAKPIFDRQMKLGEEISRLTKLRDKLLPLLMNGQLIVE